jgi:hypothetical protein
MCKDALGVHWKIPIRAVAPCGPTLALLGHPLVHSWTSLGQD